MSKGGGDSTTTTRTEIDPQIKAAYLNNVDYARNIANSMGTRQFAGFDPLYQTGEAAALGAGSGVGAQNLGTASDLTRAAAAYSPQMASAASSGPSAMASAGGYNAATGQATGAGPAAMYGGAQFDAGQVNRYFNPYQQNVIDLTQQRLETQRQQAISQANQQAQAAKAFGGSRQGVAQALSNQAWGQTAASTLAGLQQQGYESALNQYQADLARAQQAGLTNQAAYNQMAQFNAGQGQQMSLANLAALNQAGQFGAASQNAANLANQAAYNQGAQFNAQLAQQANLANQSAGLQGAQFRLGAAQQLGQQGQQQYQNALLNAQNAMQFGTARQQLAQQQMDAARNLGLERLGIMQSALGLNMPNMGGTVTSTSPLYQNTGAGILGGAMAGWKMSGGSPWGALGGGLLGLL